MQKTTFTNFWEEPEENEKKAIKSCPYVTLFRFWVGLSVCDPWGTGVSAQLEIPESANVQKVRLRNFKSPVFNIFLSVNTRL